MQKIPDTEAANDVLPQYGSKPKKPGMYLGLFHGRDDPKETMDDWGFTGPAIGPLVWCHTTYACDVKIHFTDAEDAEIYFDEVNCEFRLTIDGDLLVYDGKYYGDWTVYRVQPEDCERPVDTFRPVTRINNLCSHRKFSR